MTIETLAYAEGASIYYDSAFLAVLEDHMTYLRNHADTRITAVEAADSYKWTGDLNGYLLSVQLPAYMHFVVMRMNSMTSPTDFDENVTTLLVPSPKVLSQLRQVHTTRSTIKQ